MSTVFEAARGADCAEAARMLGLRVKRVGARAYARCLFHEERTPSMCLYPDGGGFYCFGCHAHGTAVDLYARALDLTPLEAAKQVCRDFGLAYDDRRGAPGAAPPRPEPDVRALAKRLEDLRKQYMLRLLEQARAHQAIMDRVEAEKHDPEACLDDPEWRRAMFEHAAIRTTLAALDDMPLADYLRRLEAQYAGK